MREDNSKSHHTSRWGCLENNKPGDALLGFIRHVFSHRVQGSDRHTGLSDTKVEYVTYVSPITF